MVCTSCEKYNTKSLHDCEGVRFDNWTECPCDCEKSEEALDRIASMTDESRLTYQFDALKVAINDATNSFSNLSYKYTTSTDSSTAFRNAWQSHT